jgi:hypothetical protein
MLREPSGAISRRGCERLKKIFGPKKFDSKILKRPSDASVFVLPSTPYGPLPVLGVIHCRANREKCRARSEREKYGIDPGKRIQRRKLP